MTMLATVKQEETRIMTLADYEARIYLYKEQIGTGYIGIGRTLLDAKAADVVPHGDWEAWVTRTTGLNPRQAQRCMQAAREIKDGSAMARLEISKALLLLSSGLDEEAQEKIAQQAADEGATIKQLRKEIREKQEEADMMAQKAREYMEEVDAHCERANRAETENASLRGQLETVREYVEGQKAKAADKARQEAAAAAQEEIDELRADLDAAEAREERRAEELEQLRREHQQRAMDDARGLATSTLSGFDLAAAVRAFIGSAGVLPQMASTLRSAGPAERETIRQNIETVAAWVEGARQALGIYTADDASCVIE